jgi:hypothetical protein
MESLKPSSKNKSGQIFGKGERKRQMNLIRLALKSVGVSTTP